MFEFWCSYFWIFRMFQFDNLKFQELLNQSFYFKMSSGAHFMFANVRIDFDNENELNW